ncbi:MAG: protein translocase subunit SecD, partial [Lachnospiraceae bacterium]|nr:protein translocase subunit SecD [Lachnospiraceae bacterium]
MKKMTRTKGILCFVVSVLVIVLLGLLVVNGTPNWDKLGKWKKSGQASNIKLGLDLEGGVSVTYQVSKENGKWTEQNLADTRSKLEERIHDFSNEATAYKEGDDRITVEIPGETDIQSVLDRLGATGELYFCTKLADDANVEVEGHEIYELKEGAYAGKYEVWLTGEQVASAEGQMVTDDNTKASEAVVSLTFGDEGATAFGNMTSAHVNDQTFIIYDDDVISAPTVKSAITNGKAQIDGMKDLEEAQALATGIRNGALDLKLDRISSKVVSAQLGTDALSKSVKAGIIGILLIILFLLFVYRVPGIAAGFALISYTELIMLVLNAYDITLTLPGIAGIILGIGMAVDANVIIYARIREEIAKGKTVKSAIKLGFEKATSAIVDGNITTFIAAMILIWRGSGSVRGFGQTLGIGIVISMFTALVVSRGIVWFLYYMGFDRDVFYGKEDAKKPFDFISKRYICFAISAAVAVAGIAAMAINSGAGKDAFYFSIEFAGGTSTAVEFDGKVDVDKLNKEIVPAIEKELGISGVQSQIDRETGLVTFKTPALDKDKTAKLKDLLVKNYKAKDSEDNFLPEFISGTVSKEMRTNAILATIVATICMLIYIWFRFKDIRFAGSAVLALIHDVFLVVAFYAISRTLVGTNFIACLLTLVGYSINATIVIFDRIRENKAVMKRTDDIKDVVNTSITQTLTRSIY